MRATGAKPATKDESYIIDLCDELLGTRALRHHRFPFLRGDLNKRGIRARLPVDAYYRDLDLVLEYHERQHTEPYPLFDRRIINEKSRETRGAQRKRYDRRRRTILPKHGIRLIVLDYSEFDCNSAKRLRRRVDADRAVIRRRLADFLPAKSSERKPRTKASERVTLHGEMQSILREPGNDWMRPSEIAAASNQRGRYRRGDGGSIPASQITARATKYDEIFQRRAGHQGLRIALRKGPRRR